MPPSSGRLEARGARPGVSRNGISAAGKARVVEIQRTRLLAAMVEVTSESGFLDASVARVVRRAGVSRRTFYELYEDREQCFLDAFDEAIERASHSAMDAFHPSASWAERIRVALTALLSFFDAEPGVARLLVIVSLEAGDRALKRRRSVLDRAIALVDEGCAEAKASSKSSALTAEGIVGGVLSIVHTRLLEADRGRLVDLAGPLTSMIVLPYLGASASRRELARPASTLRAVVARTGSDPLREPGMRLTYRTVRVLTAIAATPGASNHTVASSSGVTDQGQMSKLLARLQRLGLVQNSDAGKAQGTSNAWMLTERGTQIAQALNPERSR